ncbi:MAG: AraC family transcriptional regulator [Clostridium sp.]
MQNEIFDFVIKYLKSLHINCVRVSSLIRDFSHIDLGLREIILGLASNDDAMLKVKEQIESKTIYHFTDRFNCNYTIFHIPDSEEYEVVGPILLKEIKKSDIYALMSDLKIPIEAYGELKEYYYSLPYISDKMWIYSLIHRLGKELYGDENVSIRNIKLDTKDAWHKNEDDHNFKVASDPILSMKILEERYFQENELLAAVQHGNYKRIQSFLESAGMIRFANRIDDEIQECKHRLIVLNTLMRRAVYQGGVHPLHIDRLSNSHAVKINQISNVRESDEMSLAIVMNYCKLVKEHSLASYSKPVQKIIATIDASITADLRLNTFAKELFMNPSYLSALFKNEVGMTLTEYVNKKRLKYSTTLLQNTNLPIQEVAAN